MLKLTIPQQAAEEPIDWGKPQWVQHTERPDTVVLTTADQTPCNFSGTCMPCPTFPTGFYSHQWDKNDFIPLTIDIPFTISNKD